jgi:hypothetical protein
MINDRAAVAEAVAAIEAAAWTENADPDYQHARNDAGDLLYLDADNIVRTMWCSPAAKSPDPAGWRPLYVDVSPPPRRLIHCRLGAFVADWTANEAVALVREADEVAWTDDLMGHDLAARKAGKVYLFEARRPTVSTSPQGER